MAVDAPAVVRTATAADLAYIQHLAKRHTDQVGFLPTEALAAYIAAGGVTIALQNDEPCGYLLAKDRLTPLPCVRPILQACVQYDARRQAHGLALVEAVAAQARAAGRRVLRLWCRSALPANAFWQAAGFARIGTREAGGRRGGTVTLWALQIQPVRLADLLLARPERHRGPGGMYSTRPLDITPSHRYRDLAAA